MPPRQARAPPSRKTMLVNAKLSSVARPLQGGCLESRFDIAPGMVGPVELSRCIDRCLEHRERYVAKVVANGTDPMAWRSDYPAASASSEVPLGGACGAVSFFDATKSLPRGKSVGHEGSQEADPIGFCTLKAGFCNAPPYRTRYGDCDFENTWKRKDPSKRGFCTFALRESAVPKRGAYPHPPTERPCEGAELQPTPVNLSSVRSIPWAESGGSIRWQERKRIVGQSRFADSTYVAPLPGDNGNAPIFYEAVGKYRNYPAEIVVLGGGLNNMLMHLAQLLTVTCADSNGVLLLPPFDADPLRATIIQDRVSVHAAEATSSWPLRRWRRMPNCTHSTAFLGASSNMSAFRIDDNDPCMIAIADPPAPPPPTAPPPPPPGGLQQFSSFEDIFDLPYFRAQMASFCGPRTHNGSAGTFVWSGDPPPGARVVPTYVIGLGPKWNFTEYASAMVALYAAIRPNPKVEALVQTLSRAAVQHAGPRWSAVHLPIESDWWWESGWCKGRPEELNTRRCYTPAHVAQITREARSGSSGTVLLFAHDKVATTSHPWTPPSKRKYPWIKPYVVGPYICERSFGNRTFKLQLPESIPYLFRNAAEQFFAARAPAGFFGNSFSTFSKGVALLRDKRAGCNDMACRCFAYDCAQTDFPFWSRDAKTGIIPRHPGFWKLRSVSEVPGASQTHSGKPPHCELSFTPSKLEQLLQAKLAKQMTSRVRITRSGKQLEKPSIPTKFTNDTSSEGAQGVPEPQNSQLRLDDDSLSGQNRTSVPPNTKKKKRKHVMLMPEKKEEEYQLLRMKLMANETRTKRKAHPMVALSRSQHILDRESRARSAIFAKKAGGKGAGVQKVNQQLRPSDRA